MEKDADLPVAPTLAPALRVADTEAVPLAYWAGTRAIAVAARQCRWGLSVFCGLPLVPRDFLRNLLEGAGGHVYERSGRSVVLASSRVLACHTRRGGPHTFALPERRDVVDATGGRRVASATSGFTTRLAPRSTAIWFLR